MKTLKQLNKILKDNNDKMASTPMIAPAPPPPTMRRMIEESSELTRLLNIGVGKVEQQLDRMVDRMSDEIDEERKEAKRTISNLEGTIRSLENHAEGLSRANAFLRGRMATLEQTGNVKPLEPMQTDPQFIPPPKNNPPWNF